MRTSEPLSTAPQRCGIPAGRGRSRAGVERASAQVGGGALLGAHAGEGWPQHGQTAGSGFLLNMMGCSYRAKSMHCPDWACTWAPHPHSPVLMSSSTFARVFILSRGTKMVARLAPTYAATGDTGRHAWSGVVVTVVMFSAKPGSAVYSGNGEPPRLLAGAPSQTAMHLARAHRHQCHAAFAQQQMLACRPRRTTDVQVGQRNLWLDLGQPGPTGHPGARPDPARRSGHGARAA